MIVERVVERRIRQLMNVNAMQFVFYAWQRSYSRIFVVKTMQGE